MCPWVAIFRYISSLIYLKFPPAFIFYEMLPVISFRIELVSMK